MKEDELWITCCNSCIKSFLPFAIADGHKSKAFSLGLCLAGFQSVLTSRWRALPSAKWAEVETQSK